MQKRELNLVELKNWCQDLVGTFSSKQVILLTGDLGVGKTQWVQFVVQALGCKESTSPTYSVINEYETRRGLVHHVDLYRLKNQEDLDSVGFWELFSRPEGLIFVEWAGRLNKEDIPLDWKRITVNISGSGEQRVFDYEVH